MSNPSDPILSERRGAAGLITINRPKALNALMWIASAARRTLSPCTRC